MSANGASKKDLRKALERLQIENAGLKFEIDKCKKYQSLLTNEIHVIINTLADIAGLPQDPCPGWQPCIENIKLKLMGKV